METLATYGASDLPTRVVRPARVTSSVNVWTAVPLPANDSDTISFVGGSAYMVLALIHDGYNATQLLSKLKASPPYFAGWSIAQDASGAPLLWTSLDPVPSWDNGYISKLPPPTQGYQWLVAIGFPPPQGDTEQLSRTPLGIFVYKIARLWESVPAGQQPKTTTAPGSSSAPLIIGGLIVAAAAGGGVYWWWRRRRRRA